MLTVNVFGVTPAQKKESVVPVCVIKANGREVEVPVTAIFKGSKRIKKGFMRMHGLL